MEYSKNISQLMEKCKKNREKKLENEIKIKAYTEK